MEKSSSSKSQSIDQRLPADREQTRLKCLLLLSSFPAWLLDPFGTSQPGLFTETGVKTLLRMTRHGSIGLAPGRTFTLLCTNYDVNGRSPATSSSATSLSGPFRPKFPSRMLHKEATAFFCEHDLLDFWPLTLDQVGGKIQQNFLSIYYNLYFINALMLLS